MGWAMATIAVLCPAWVLAGDQETAQQIADSLRTSGKMADYRVSVEFENGTAKLIGRVANPQQMQQAIALAESVPGVTGVVNQLEVKTSQSTGGGQVRSAEYNANAGNQSSGSLMSGFKDMLAPSRKPSNSNTASNSPRLAAPSAAGATDPLAQSQAATFTPSASRRYANEPVFTNDPAARASNGQSAQGEALVNYQAPAEPGAMIPAKAYPMNANKQQVMQTGHHLRAGGPGPAFTPAMAGPSGPAMYDQPHMPGYAWPSYAAYPNYAAVTYPKQYSATAWPYIGPFYPYPQVPLGWRRVTMQWKDGWWWLDFSDKKHRW
jgi:hypothetical protein